MTHAMLEMKLCPLGEIPPGEGRNFSAFGEKIAVFHTRDGAVYAVRRPRALIVRVRWPMAWWAEVRSSAPYTAGNST